jgi:hypothetical protein
MTNTCMRVDVLCGVTNGDASVWVVMLTVNMLLNTSTVESVRTCKSAHMMVHSTINTL